MRLLIILYIIISVALSLRCFNGGKLSAHSMSVTPLKSTPKVQNWNTVQI